MLSLDFVNDILFWVALYLLVWNGYILIFNKGVPNIRTAPAVRKKIIEILKEKSAQHAGKLYTIIDLGSGNGLFTRQIARSMPHARVIGLEISKPSYLWSIMLKKLFKIENLEYKRADFFSYDLSKANAVVLYLSVYEMGRIGKKLHENLKKGTLVTSNRFPLGHGWSPSEIINVKTLYPFQKKLHVYYQS